MIYLDIQGLNNHMPEQDNQIKEKNIEVNENGDCIQINRNHTFRTY